MAARSDGSASTARRSSSISLAMATSYMCSAISGKSILRNNSSEDERSSVKCSERFCYDDAKESRDGGGPESRNLSQRTARVDVSAAPRAAHLADAPVACGRAHYREDSCTWDASVSGAANCGEATAPRPPTRQPSSTSWDTTRCGSPA